MQQGLTQRSLTEPAIGRLRVILLLVVAAVLAGCATTPSAPEKPAPLVDRTAETDYRLDAVNENLAKADGLDAEGDRTGAEAELEAARKALPQDHRRERAYLDALLAAVWGRGGDGRDPAKAAAFLKQSLDQSLSDPRTFGEAKLAEVAVMLGAEDLPGAVRVGDEACAAFERAQAWTRLADASRELAAGLHEFGLSVHAVRVSRRGANVAEQLKDDPRALRAWLDVGSYLPATAGAEMDEAFLRAYAAAYRVGRVAWRSIVIATATAALFGGGHHKLAAQWGDRLRDNEEGNWPNARESGLKPADHARLSAHYALSLHKARPGDNRLKEALLAARKLIDEAGPADAEGRLLEREVKTALLQIESGK